MDRIGRFTVILATLLLPGFEPWPCRAQSSARRAASIPPPRPGSDFAAGEAKPAPLEPTELRLPPLVVPALEDLLEAAREPSRSSPVERFRLCLSTAGRSAAPHGARPLRAAIAPPRLAAIRPRGSSLRRSSRPTCGFPINLATALRLSDARPLIVAAAQASVWVAEAQLTRAKVLWVPTLMFGADYIRHDGGGPDFNKGVMTAPSVNYFYAGGGLSGVQSRFISVLNLTDAFFEPLVARQVLNSRQWDIQTAKNDALLMTADAYFRCTSTGACMPAPSTASSGGTTWSSRSRSLSEDLVPRVEVDRARNMLADLEQQATSAREAWRVHSADLTQVLRLDPRAVVVPLEHDHLQLTLIDPAQPLHDLQRDRR